MPNNNLILIYQSVFEILNIQRVWKAAVVHGLGVGDVQEVWALGLELGVGGHHEVDALHLNQPSFLQEQVLHHLQPGHTHTQTNDNFMTVYRR